jgi:hypothetical protein
MPWRLAVDDIARGACKLSLTIRSFSSSDQRRGDQSRPPQAVAHGDKINLAAIDANALIGNH